MLFSKKNTNTVSIDVPTLLKGLVDTIIGALCENFVTRADVDSIVLDSVERVLRAREITPAATESEENESEIAVSDVKNEPQTKKPAPVILGNPGRSRGQH